MKDVEGPILPVLYVAVGAAVMAVNILLYLTMARSLGRALPSSGKGTMVLLFFYIALLLFFLCGYVAVGVSFFVPAIAINSTLVALIFLFGSLFVLLGIVLQRALIRAVNRSNLATITALVNAVEARDPNLNGHSQHVARLALLLYRQLPRKYRRRAPAAQLEYAAMLHDIGKLGVSEKTLNKEAALSEEEWQEMREHPRVGAQILSPLEHCRQISQWILCHHERMDGGGYYGCPGQDIPLASRIISVADTYSAITMNRSYRRARGYQQAAEVLRQCRGTQLDSVVVDAFLSIPREKVEACMVQAGAAAGGKEHVA